jgi:hypothetical protein
MIMERALRHLSPEDPFREEQAGNLAHLRASPRRMLMLALQIADRAREIELELGVSRTRRRDPLHRRVLAHLGLPVRLEEEREHADASYVFGGTMRRRHDDPGTVAPLDDEVAASQRSED